VVADRFEGHYEDHYEDHYADHHEDHYEDHHEDHHELVAPTLRHGRFSTAEADRRWPDWACLSK